MLIFGIALIFALLMRSPARIYGMEPTTSDRDSDMRPEPISPLSPFSPNPLCTLSVPFVVVGGHDMGHVINNNTGK